MKKAVSYKRILAYLFDILIVTLISSLFTRFIPLSDEYHDKYNELSNVVISYQEGEIEEKEYLEKVNDISYVISKETVSTSIVTVVITTIYFVVVAYYMNGQTIGKKITKLQIVSTENKKLTMNNYLIRSLIVDSIFMNIINIVLILVLEKGMFLKANEVVSTVFGAFYVLLFAMILFKEDGRGLHDILAKTQVVEKEIINEEIKEIEVVEKKEEKKVTKKTTTKNKKTKK